MASYLEPISFNTHLLYSPPLINNLKKVNLAVIKCSDAKWSGKVDSLNNSCTIS